MASCEKEFVIASALGLHARPAGRFAARAGEFECEVQVGRGGEWVDGRSILSLLSLAAAQGTTLRVRTDGADAERAVLELGALLEDPEDR